MVTANSPCLLPKCEGDKVWLTPTEFAPLVHRSYYTVIAWIKDGTLLDFGYQVYQDPKKRWLIKAPKTLLIL